MHEYDVTVTTSASPAIVWKLLVDAASWPLWSKVDSLDTTRSVDLDPGGDDGVGAVRAFRTGRTVTGERLTEKVEQRLLGLRRRVQFVDAQLSRAHRAGSDGDRGHGYSLVRHVRDEQTVGLGHAALPPEVHAGNGGRPGPLRRGVEADSVMPTVITGKGEIVNRPLLFLDVDGPLNPYAANPEKRPDGYITLRVPQDSGNPGEPGGLSVRRRPLRVWLNPEHGQALLQLDYELCWATTWMDDANRWIAPVLGLPELPFVEFGDALLQERPDGVHWKTGPLVDYANGRSFAWVDDEQSDLDDVYVTAHHRGPRVFCTTSTPESASVRTTSARSPNFRIHRSPTRGRQRRPAHKEMKAVRATNKICRLRDEYRKLLWRETLHSNGGLSSPG